MGLASTTAAAIAVVEYQLDGSLAHRLAIDGAVKNHVGHGLATQILRGTFTHDPAHSVDNIGLATAIGADDGAHITREIYRGGIDERLEASQFNRL